MKNLLQPTKIKDFSTAAKELKEKLAKQPAPHLVMAFVLNAETLTAAERNEIETCYRNDSEFRRKVKHIRKNKQVYRSELV